MSDWPTKVRIVEVGPRDGLQNESAFVPTAAKLKFITDLIGAGLTDIEVTSFVHPQGVPQLADALEVIRGLPNTDKVVFSALVPNEKGLARAIESGNKRIAVFTAASETFVRRNINKTIRESLDAFKPIVSSALSHGVSVRGYLSTCFVCPFEGDVAKERVRELTEELLTIGVDEVSISDTIGAASPADVQRTVGYVLESIPASRLALHFHDTYGTALANVFAGLQLGISTFDSSAGGLGGCPYAPGASGNVASEDLVYMLDRMGIATGVNLEAVVTAAEGLTQVLKKPLNSRQWQRLRGKSGDTGCGSRSSDSLSARSSCADRSHADGAKPTSNVIDPRD